MMQNYMVVLCLCILYFIQGIPYGLQAKALPLYFYQVRNYPIETVTKLSFLMTPWIILKPLIASYLQTNSSITWFVYIGIFGNTALNFALSIIMSDEASVNIHNILVVLFLVNCSTVVIDVASDRLAIASASSDEDLKFMGISNSIQVVAYKFGAIFGVFLINFLGYDNVGTLFIIFSIFYLLSLCIVFILFQTFKVGQKVTSHVIEQSSPNNELYSSLKYIISMPGTLCLLAFVLTYKMGEAGSNSIYPLLLLQRGVSKETVSYITSTIGDPLSLIGSLIGGFIWKVYRPYKPILTLTIMLSSIGCVRIIPLMMQYVSLTRNIPGFIEISLGIGFLSLVGGVTSTLTFTLMMTLSYKANEQYQASHYALLSSVEVFGKLVFSAYVGSLSIYLTVFQVYAMFSLITVLSSVWLFVCKNSFNYKIKLNKFE